MNAQLQSMQQQLNELKTKPPLHVEYHFDQLKVNRLEGTLNVGFTPQSAPDIESLELPQSQNWNIEQAKPEPQNDPIRGLQAELAAYMNREGAQNLYSLERQYAFPLDDAHRNRIIEDVKRQLNERVRYYATVKPYPEQGSDMEKREWHDQVVDKTVRDIDGAFTAYMQKFAAKERSDPAP